MNDTKESVTDALPEPDLLFFDDRLQSPMHGYTPTAVMQIIDTLRAQLAEAQRDSERLDWLNANACEFVMESNNEDIPNFSYHPNVRAAIDAAKEKKNGT